MKYFSCFFVCILFSSGVIEVSAHSHPVKNNPAAHLTSVTISEYMDEYKRLGGTHDIIIENMNCKSFSEAPLWEGVMSEILSKYTGDRFPSQLILLGQEAWAAYLSARDSLEVDIPVMCGLVSSNMFILPKDTVRHLDEWMPNSVDWITDHLEIPELKAGFVNIYNVEDNIRMIKAFYPNVKNIAFISDNTYGGVAMQALVRKHMKNHPELHLILLDGRLHTIYSILDELQHLPQNTVILLGTWRVDMNEGYFVRNATYSMMEAAPNIPVFSPSSMSLGTWSIGGVSPDYQKLGVDMATASVHMDNFPADTVPRISITPDKAVLDSRKVNEWGLDPQLVPFDVEIVNQPISFYQQYTYQIWLTCTIFALLSAGFLITLSYYFRTKRLKDRLLTYGKDLREAKEKAEDANRLKSAFLANMSHEIRTPLNSIVGFSDVLASTETNEGERECYYQIIKTNSDLLLRLINDILDLSRLEANRVSLSFEECDVILLCNQVVSTVSYSRHSKNEFVFKNEHDSFPLVTDVQRMQQVLINLLTNADKFTKDGTVTLSFSVNNESGLATFSVTDTGCGIPKEKQRLVFERFEKLNEYAQGTGLGLAICKLIVSKWSGVIWIDPNYTDGARFVFSHPLEIKQK